jgi:hypothetical protein
MEMLLGVTVISRYFPKRQAFMINLGGLQPTQQRFI